MLSLTAKARDLAQDIKKMRKEGDLPAVFYGMGNKSTPISVSKIEFKKILEKAGESSAVKVTGPNFSVDALIHEIQLDPVTNEPMHVDFLVIDMTKKIKVKVPIEFTGVSEAVKSSLGILVKVLHEAEIEALPKDLPHSLTADISKLSGLDSLVLVSDIVLPQGVTMITKHGEVVASIAEQKEEKIETAEPVDLTKIEVEKKGKKEEEGAEAPAGEEKK